MKKERIAKVNDEILREISMLVRMEIKDPRIDIMTCITRVETANDLSHCKVFVSVMGDDLKKKSALEAFKSCAGFVRREIAKRVNLRQTPEFSFVIDDSLEQSLKISKIISEIKANAKNEEEE